MTQMMSKAWELAQQNLKKAQKNQKFHHDKNSRNVDFQVSERVFVYMPVLKSGPAHKLSRPFKGPFRVINTYPNGVGLVPVDKPRASPIRIALNRVRRCPDDVEPEEDVLVGDPQSEENSKQSEMANVESAGHSANMEQSPNTVKGKDDADGMGDVTMWENRLRPRNSSSRMT